MGTPGEVRQEHQQDLQSSSQQPQVRTSLVLCCCCYSFLLLPFICRVIWSSFGHSYVLNRNVAAELRLNNAEAESEMGTSVWDPAAAGAIMEGTTTRLPEGEKYMWYSPHSGFSNQARELMHALKIAFLLNRTLILPPVLDHFELEYGLCLDPLLDHREFRKLAWAAITARFNPSSPRGYTSMADIIDLSSIKSTVKTIDLRVFLALWCNVDFSPTCLGPVCHNFARDLNLRPPGAISTCAARFFSTPGGNKGSNLIHEVHDDCRTTIWTHGESPAERALLEQLLVEQLHNDTTLPSNVNVSSLHIRRKDVVETLGPDSPAGESFLVTFGSMFGKRYRDRTLMVDINGAPPNKSLASILTRIEHQTFSEDMRDAGLYFVQEKIKEPFFCAHVRLDDGVFLFDQESRIFRPLRERLELLEMMSSSNQTTREPLNVFVMTDLARTMWQGTYLYDLDVNPKYKIHTMDGEEDLLTDVTQKIYFHEYALVHSFLPKPPDLRQIVESSRQNERSRPRLKEEKKYQTHASNVRLFVEEIVCSCATLGFQGTWPSTIDKNIVNMREAQMCTI